jgi:hypothetical protein
VLRGWIPHDEGTLAQSAHRILLGQVPHRDFDELYSGGLSFLHAIAFRTLGENLVSLRIVLLTTAILTTPGVYYIASRFTPPFAAGALCIAAFLWSFPNYPASMPSWYNLALAVFGCAALFRYLETDRRRWIFVAGVCSGLSLIIKITGLYFIVAAALFLLFDVYTRRHRERLGGSFTRITGVLPILLGLTVAVAPFALMASNARPTIFVELGLPAALTGLGVVVVAFRSMREGRSPRLSDLVEVAWPFAFGVLIPVTAFVCMYFKWHALPALYRGLFILPRRRIELAALAEAPLAALLATVPFLRVALSKGYSGAVVRTYEVAVIAALQFALIVWSKFDARVFELVWLSIQMTVLPVVLAGMVLTLQHAPADSLVLLRRRQLFLVLAATAWCALVQFPFGAPIYFAYVAPFAILSIGSLVAVRGTLAPRLAAPLLLALVAAGFLVRPMRLSFELPSVIFESQSSALLDLPRGGLIVRRDDRNVYVGLSSLISRHASSTYIYVTPDAPEVYFLSERENPTRTLFDFFDEPIGRDSRVLADIRAHGVTLVVINKKPAFSPRISALLYDSLTHRFPWSAQIGTFEVRWRS